MWVEERKPKFEAKQFIGGLSNTIELIKWLDGVRGVLSTTWLPPFTREGYITGFSKEVLRIQMTDGAISVEVGEWIIKDPSKPSAQQISFCAPETFDFKYVMVEEVDNGSDVG